MCQIELLKSPKDLITFSAEFCYNPEEAFNLEGDNKFNKVNIAEQLTRIRALKQTPDIEIGRIGYLYKEGIHTPQNITGITWKLDNTSKLKILEHPLWTLPPKKDENGNPIVIQNVSFDAPVDDGVDLCEKVASDFNVENELPKEINYGYSENIESFLNNLSEIHEKYQK